MTLNDVIAFLFWPIYAVGFVLGFAWDMLRRGFLNGRNA